MALRPIRKLDLESRTLGYGVDTAHITRRRVIVPEDFYKAFFVGELKALFNTISCRFKYFRLLEVFEVRSGWLAAYLATTFPIAAVSRIAQKEDRPPVGCQDTALSPRVL